MLLFSLDLHNLDLPGYHKLISRNREGAQANRGEVGLFMKDSITYTIRQGLSVFIPHVFESLFTDVVNKHHRNNIIAVIYRHESQI